MVYLARGADSNEVLTAQRFLIYHGYLSFDAANTNPGYFGENTQRALAEFMRDAQTMLRNTGIRPDGDELAGRVISNDTVALMRAWERHQQNIYRLNPGQFGRSGQVYVLDPSTETLSRPGGGRIDLDDFEPRRPTYVIDPGHGVIKRQGHDFGASVGGVQEARLTRDISMDVARELSRRGYDVIVTRDDDNSRSPDGFGFRHRAARAGTAGLISLHADIAGNGASGTRLIVDRRASGASRSADLRRAIARDDDGDVIADDYHRERGLQMLSPGSLGPMVPATLIEMGFLSNPGDRRRLSDQGWQTRFARELADDLIEFNHMDGDLAALQGQRGVQRGDAGRAPQPSAPERPAAPLRDRFNDRRIIRYEIDPGDNLVRISRRYGVAVDDLRHVNHVRGSHIEVGDNLIIPDVREITVRSGQNLNMIADRLLADSHAISQGNMVALIAHLNGIDPSRIRAGQDLIIPEGPQEAAAILGRLQAQGVRIGSSQREV